MIYLHQNKVVGENLQQDVSLEQQRLLKRRVDASKTTVREFMLADKPSKKR